MGLDCVSDWPCDLGKAIMLPWVSVSPSVSKGLDESLTTTAVSKLPGFESQPSLAKALCFSFLPSFVKWALKNSTLRVAMKFEKVNAREVVPSACLIYVSYY